MNKIHIRDIGILPQTNGNSHTFVKLPLDVGNLPSNVAYGMVDWVSHFNGKPLVEFTKVSGQRYNLSKNYIKYLIISHVWNEFSADRLIYDQQCMIQLTKLL